MSLNPLRCNKIHVSAERLAMYRYLPDMTPYFTTDGQSTKIHACKWQVLNYSGFFYLQSYFSLGVVEYGKRDYLNRTQI